MKKNIVKLLLLFQVVWVFHGGIVFTNSTSGESEKYSYNYGGFYGLVKIACTTFVESIGRVVEVSCDLPVFPSEESKPQPVQKVCLCFISLNARITNLEKITSMVRYILSLKTNILQNFRFSTLNFVLNYLWLMFLFLYIHRLRYFFLMARSSIWDNIVSYRGRFIENPNCFWANAQEQLGFFTCREKEKNNRFPIENVGNDILHTISYSYLISDKRGKNL